LTVSQWQLNLDEAPDQDKKVAQGIDWSDSCHLDAGLYFIG